MNRILTASVALAATLGTAGLALAQGNAPNPNMQTPNMSTQSPGINSATPNTGVNPGMTPSAAGNSQQSMQNGPMNSQQNLQQAQEQLRSQGLYNGAIDGQFGPQMRTALLQFQQRNGLPQTGTLDEQTSARLTQSSNSNNLSPTPTSGSNMQGTTGGSQMKPSSPTNHY